jgi:hypothetical protein
MKRLFLACLVMLAGSVAHAQTVRELYPLTANMDYYFNCSTGSNLNSGAASFPFADPLFAYNFLQQHVDLAGYTVTLHGQVGCGGVAWTFSGPLVGAKGATSFVIVGTGQSMQIGAPANGYAFQVQNDAGITVQNFSCTGGTGSGGCLLANGGTIIAGGVAASMWFINDASNSLADAAGPRSIIQIIGTIGLTSQAGSANTVIVSEDHALITLPSAWGIGTVNWTLGFAVADLGGMIDGTGFSFSGGGTGTRYVASSNAIIFTGGSGGATFYPGNAGGTTATGGFYQ